MQCGKIFTLLVIYYNLRSLSWDWNHNHNLCYLAWVSLYFLWGLRLSLSFMVNSMVHKWNLHHAQASFYQWINKYHHEIKWDMMWLINPLAKKTILHGASPFCLCILDKAFRFRLWDSTIEFSVLTSNHKLHKVT